MATIQNPTLFSAYFKIEADKLNQAGLIDPFIDVDTQLFIDPVLLEKSSNPVISGKAISAFRSHFENFVRLLAISENRNDAAWRNAERLLDLSEPPENGLGYGGSGRSGSSRPDEVRDAIMQTAKEIIELGAKDPEMVSLMGFFEENVGPDTISDFTTRVIIEQLVEITSQFCAAHDIPMTEFADFPEHGLPVAIDKNGKRRALLLVPQDIVRELPIANDWSDIENAISRSNRIRAQVNTLLAGIAQPTIADRKDALRSIALQSPQNFEEFLAAVKEHVRTYDPNVDALGYYRMKAILAAGFDGLKTDKKYDLAKGPEEIVRLVKDTLQFFQHHVETGNLWEELWVGNKPKKERAAQLIYYAIADAFCHAHGADISPEANMGGGPVDFKFSHGYDARVLVEMKRSTGTVEHGYKRQLEIYLDASRSQHGIFVVMDFGGLGKKFEKIEALRLARIAAGQRASEILVIDASKKESASKRK